MSEFVLTAPQQRPAIPSKKMPRCPKHGLYYAQEDCFYCVIETAEAKESDANREAVAS